ncbi:hypothetical protein A5675_07860 [Mycobacterium malmoense]|uniref:Transmembrane protein n=1 Tax=Mycobacterium malmoense TaxID=1780 RepID=A0A1B9DF56_MYCMA|nr:hypothetical protein [Mycobacterium malmoense]OCB22670.1 hypothetical protein A5674_25505 [Mycobacterium malmoense]OCB28474.1 hypothetical protein A5675_07860 [Mycobacterium malmoense]OCB34978.1 hypothetical protein A5676_25085 [Mycobacterium malmoense]OCB35003.1 hypothetical protein A5676_25250 [Mycobacterium malmoense]OCB64108.1 hypothetical protein A5677_09690 [Mycobacterium malmoense]
MEIFIWDPRCWRIARVFGRNPLLRRADRIEAVVILVALAVSLIAVPVAGLVGAATYSARDRVYTQEAHQRHPLTATVIDARPEDLGVTVVQAKWPGPRGERSGTLETAERAKAGGTVEIWVDAHGNPVVPPTPTWLAAAEAVGMAVVTALGAAMAMSALVAVARSRLDRIRDELWERDIEFLAEAS